MIDTPREPVLTEQELETLLAIFVHSWQSEIDRFKYADQVRVSHRALQAQVAALEQQLSTYQDRNIFLEQQFDTARALLIQILNSVTPLGTITDADVAWAKKQIMI